MTDQQINAAITEACGWVPDCDRGICWDKHGNAIITVPNYCSDLNAMHEAEKVLNKEQLREYQIYMYDMACEIDNTCGRWMPYSATARYRAEAFLKSLGKWEEVQG
tara:strand:- start:1059 stop:1376 length:318 start_codon:yes stop_codon:yes gene_type:complete